MHKRSNAQMLKRQMLKYTNAQMLESSNAQMPNPQMLKYQMLEHNKQIVDRLATPKTTTKQNQTKQSKQSNHGPVASCSWNRPGVSAAPSSA